MKSIQNIHFHPKIKNIAELEEEEVIEKGRKAREFVLSKKNNKVQTRKIIELVKNDLRIINDVYYDTYI